MARQPLRLVIASYDRLYRVWHGLDRPGAAIAPLLRLEIRRCRRPRRLTDGTTLVRGAPVGMLHLWNERVAALHGDGWRPLEIGLEFRRLLRESLRQLAHETTPGGPLEALSAFSAVTIFHRGLGRLGFERDPRPLWLPRLTGVYQRALLASLHPGGIARLAALHHRRAARLWISRARLRDLYGTVRATY
jgi:hypothetical protein